MADSSTALESVYTTLCKTVITNWPKNPCLHTSVRKECVNNTDKLYQLCGGLNENVSHRLGLCEKRNTLFHYVASSSGWPGTHRGWPAPASRVLRLRLCSSTATRAIFHNEAPFQVFKLKAQLCWLSTVYGPFLMLLSLLKPWLWLPWSWHLVS